MRTPYVAITVHGLSWNAPVSGRSGTSAGPSGKAAGKPAGKAAGKAAGTVEDGPGQPIF
ncbi:hypothetical protein [Streptomyces sp. RKAG293]|uniref:hypothetical protein n=1 Tax=Streptomyces sp. RKAG293 TaxID=2893403 RepID=UPI0020342F8A|nr:hypothetical protein [Streptomyces sp. RKAG293]MCM2422474.1 hypothetical protein [Streptomyces sp. RKAG293]